MFDRTHSQEGNHVVMAYPQPGPYPAYPQYPGQTGMPAKPPAPKTVQNAFYLMLAGAALAVIQTIVTLASKSQIRDSIRTHSPSYTTTQIDNMTNAAMVGAVVGGLIGIGLWTWMAFANRAGKNWARITGTVFFGIESLLVVIGLAATTASAASTANVSGISTALSVLSWLVGLATVIMLWNKQSGPYFKPQPIGPGGPGYPYPYAMPGQQPMPPTGSQPPYDMPQPPQQQPPTDPWSNPPQQ